MPGRIARFGHNNRHHHGKVNGMRGREQLWNDNRELLRNVIWGRESLFGYAIRSHLRRRREWPERLRDYPVVRLRTELEVETFLANARRAGVTGRPGDGPPQQPRAGSDSPTR